MDATLPNAQGSARRSSTARSSSSSRYLAQQPTSAPYDAAFCGPSQSSGFSLDNGMHIPTGPNPQPAQNERHSPPSNVPFAYTQMYSGTPYYSMSAPIPGYEYGGQQPLPSYTQMPDALLASDGSFASTSLAAPFQGPIPDGRFSPYGGLSRRSSVALPQTTPPTFSTDPADLILEGSIRQTNDQPWITPAASPAIPVAKPNIATDTMRKMAHERRTRPAEYGCNVCGATFTAKHNLRKSWST
ncbi:hypothetical protein BD626DRAFT_567757 [Schizophyllum amplum]|uniref:Uncharacterized protein n=1 Tax=Schizophyllum amplum TaxID=97359 RepID=A0A550CJE5_9AGAR|nr:hypothetical protein BD626DRAFT_567757 [Auriculariopsis ampla]